MKKGIVDRIEEGIAVIETDDGFVEIKVSDVEVSEGDRVEFRDGVILKSEKVDDTEAKKLLEKLFG